MKGLRQTIPLWTRLFAIFLGFSLLFWLSIEDADETIAILFAILVCTWASAALLVRKIIQLPTPFYSYILIGILAGAAITPLALFLMAFKTGLHAHAVSDYSNQQIISVISRTPIWVIGGLFISMGLGTLDYSWQIQSESNHATKC